MNNLFRKTTPLLKNVFSIKHSNKKEIFRYLSLAPNFSAKFRLVREPSSPSRENLPKMNKEQTKKPIFNSQLNFQDMKYPLMINSPLIAGMSLVVLQSVLIGGEMPEILKFIFKSSFLYGSIFTGLHFGIKVQSDEKITAVTFADIKKKFILLAGVLGISQTLAMVPLPLPVFVGFYFTLYGLLNKIMEDINEEVNEDVHKTKVVLMFIALMNLIFIILSYSNFKESMKDAENFDKLTDEFLSVNDEKFEAGLIDKEKFLLAVDYRLFKINKSDI